ncbi:MAG: aminotransferase class I/II-fold pyridoxal phosphate-dependent enzyme [Pyrinomonadaceae bacterium]
MNKQSSYMHWAKTRPPAKYDLALSGVLNLPFAEFQVALDDLELHGANGYGYRPLIEALASHCRVPPESVVTVSGGTSMANHLAMATLLDHGDEVLIEEPTYDPLLAIAGYLGAHIKRFPRPFADGFRVDVEVLANQITPRTRLIVLTNMHNPSSVLVDNETLKEIGRLARSVGARVLVDEVYLEAMFEHGPGSCVHLGPEFIATSSLTKGYGLSGLRCGWILAAPQWAQSMWRLKDIFDGVGPHPTERLSVVALEQLPHIAARAQGILGSNRASLNEFLDTRNDLHAIRTDTGTTSFPLLRHGDVETLCTLLNEKYETAIVPGKFFEMPQHFRIGICCPPETFKTGLERLASALDSRLQAG